MENFQKYLENLISNQVKLTNETPYVNLNPLSRNPGSAPVSECQTVWNHIKTDILSVLMWSKVFEKVISKMIKMAPSKERVKRRRFVPKNSRYLHEFPGKIIPSHCSGFSFLHVTISNLFDGSAVVECLTKTEGLQVQASLVSLRCVLEQDTIFLA